MGSCVSTPVVVKPNPKVIKPYIVLSQVNDANNTNIINNKPNITAIELLAYNNALEEKLKLCTLKNTPKKLYNFNKAKIVKVYDGDTFTIVYNDNTGIKEEFLQNRIRLHGIDCCEIKDKDSDKKKKANEAKEFVKKLILNEIVDVEILNGKKVNGKIVNEKYGRLIGRVSFKGQDIATLLLDVVKEYPA